MKTTLSPRLSVKPEGRPDIWLPTKDSLLSYIAFKAFEQIHCFLPVNGALIGALIGADWDVESVVEEIQHPDAVVAVFTNPHTNAGHSLAIKRSNPPGLKCFDIGPITHADLEGDAMISPLLKPQPRPRKAKRPIARTSKPSRIRKTAKGKTKHAADLAWAKAIRESGPCAARGVLTLWNDGKGPVAYRHDICHGPIEAAHIVSRRYSATRTDLRNGLPLCHYVHAFFTSHPLAWDAFIAYKIGKTAYSTLKQKALTGPKAAA